MSFITILTCSNIVVACQDKSVIYPPITLYFTCREENLINDRVDSPPNIRGMVEEYINKDMLITTERMAKELCELFSFCFKVDIYESEDYVVSYEKDGE